MSRSDDGDDTIRKHSGWLIPLAALLVILVLSVLILLYYLVPTPPPLFTEQISPSSDSSIASLQVGGLKLSIPSNYLEFESARRGGIRREVALFAMLPDMTGWSNWDAQAFSDNAVNSRIVHMLIREERVDLSEADRLQRVYLAYVVDPKGTPGPSGLTRYTFRADSGYRREDLFVGETADGPTVLRCVKFSAEAPSPSCLRDVRLAKGVALSYRFKRARLNHWRDVSAGVDKVIASFEKPTGK